MYLRCFAQYTTEGSLQCPLMKVIARLALDNSEVLWVEWLLV